ncbi:L51-S25-CI-B8 domain-containing protein [Aphelenchoides besseyi]|nr:L51-S25-CI-B8 domain-containing protein [Aphelenchoides besseyi]KAI6220282.1 L51-S25-CI-B8 domain-containing protein [Aphelenchoides besseyi]
MPAIPRVDRLKTIFSAAKQLNFGYQLTGFPTAPQWNGWNGRAIPQLHRLTIRFCRKDVTSAGVREFISTELEAFARQNPATAIYVLPARQCIPTFRGEYANGRMVHINAKHFTLDQVCRHLNDLRSRSGEPIVKFVSNQTAENKSIQGQWTPQTWQSTEQNVYWSELPQAKFSPHRTTEITATDYVLDKSVPINGTEEPVTAHAVNH